VTRNRGFRAGIRVRRSVSIRPLRPPRPAGQLRRLRSRAGSCQACSIRTCWSSDHGRRTASGIWRRARGGVWTATAPSPPSGPKRTSSNTICTASGSSKVTMCAQPTGSWPGWLDATSPSPERAPTLSRQGGPVQADLVLRRSLRDRPSPRAPDRADCWVALCHCWQIISLNSHRPAVSAAGRRGSDWINSM
jgi:hypothetical protein